MTNEELIHDLVALKSSFEFKSEVGDGVYVAPDWSRVAWSYQEIPYFNDFNREIIKPGDREFPDGCVVIRCDEDFFIVAILPYRFVGLSCREIVGVLWPNLVDESSFNPDSGSPDWDAINAIRSTVERYTCRDEWEKLDAYIEESMASMTDSQKEWLIDCVLPYKKFLARSGRLLP